VAAVAVLLAALAVALVAVSFASYATVKARLDAFASDGNADISRADFDAIVVRLRIAAGAIAILAVGVYTMRLRLSRLLAGLATSSGASVRALRLALGNAIAQESPVHLGALALVTLAGLLVRLDFLFQPMRYDESVTYVHYASRPWYIALTTYTAPNNHVFHSLLVHLSTVVFGGAPWAIRLPAFTAGLLLVPASYITARTLFGRNAALLTAGLVASSSVLIEYSTNARGYTLLTLDFVLLLALATHLRTSTNPAEWLAFAVLAALGFWTVPVMLYAFGAVVLWLAVSILREPQRRPLLWRLALSVVGTGVLSALLYAPIVSASGLHSLVANEFVKSRSWSYFGNHLLHSLVSTGRGWHRDIPFPLGVLIALGFALGVLVHRRVSRTAVPPVLAALAWIAPVVVVQRVVPFERVWLFLLPLYLMTASAGIVFALRPLAERVRRREIAAAALVVALAASFSGTAVATQSVYHSEDTSTFRDGRYVAAFLASKLRPGDKILVAPPADAILEYWLDRRHLDPATLLYWSWPGKTQRFLVVVKEGPHDYPLPYVLADRRLQGARLGRPHLLHHYPGSDVYEVRRALG